MGYLSKVVVEGFFSLMSAIWIIVSKRKVFKKAGENGRGALIPIYNDYLIFKIAGHKKRIWRILFPPVYLFVRIAILFDIAKKFGKNVWFAVGLNYIPVVFYPILARGKAGYDGMKNMSRTLFWKIVAGIMGTIALCISAFFWVLYHPRQNVKLDEIRLSIQTPMMKMLSDYLLDGRADNYFGLIDEHEFFYNDPDMISWEEFEPHIEKLQRGDILFTDGARYISSIVIPGTRKHALIYLGSGEIIDATSKGVTTGNLKDLDNLSRGSLLQSIIAFRPNLNDEQKQIFINFAFAQLGKPYDFDYNKEDKEAYYCSELVADGLAEAGIDVTYESKSIGKMVISPEDMVKYIQEIGIQNGEFEYVFYLAKDDDFNLIQLDKYDKTTLMSFLTLKS